MKTEDREEGPTTRASVRSEVKREGMREGKGRT